MNVSVWYEWTALELKTLAPNSVLDTRTFFWHSSYRCVEAN